MELSFHGGKCCGVKTLWNFGYGKESLNEILSAVPYEAVRALDQHGESVRTEDRVMGEAMPAETRLQRLDRYLEWLKKNRPKGLIECYLADNSSIYFNQMLSGWPEELLKRGFKRGPTFKNSNSGNNVTQFYLIMDGNKEK